ncbi:MAG: Hpt domain-containing protein [Spirochaetota bacterium]
MSEDFDELTPFDLSKLESKYDDAPDVLEEIISIFRDEAPQRLELLNSGVRDGDAAQVQKAAHSLANTTGTLMAERALALARATEASARAADYELMSDRAQELAAEVSRILEQMEARHTG